MDVDEFDPTEIELGTELHERELVSTPGAATTARAGAVIRTPPNQNITVLPHVRAFADAVKQATGADSFGTYGGHSPTPERALDIFTPVNSDRLGNAICNFAIQNLRVYGVDYIIYRQRIYNPEVATYWRGMADRGDNTQNHFDHAHISFESKGGGVLPAPTPEPSEEDEMFSRSTIASRHLVAGHSGLLLTAVGKTHGSAVVQRPADGTLSQRWELWGHEDGTISFVNRWSGLALDRPDYRTDPGTKLQVARSEFNNAQRWKGDDLPIPGFTILQVPGKDTCVDVTGVSLTAEAATQLWTVRRGLNQAFKLAVTI